jgi:deazaflavin-dependent oxidoreductase (nitroreductase family)
MAIKRNKLVELFWKIHPWLYKTSGGKIGGKIVGMPVLLLKTTGRKSGQARERALTYMPHGDSFVVIASFLGEPRHPDWWLNLQARPQATVTHGRAVIPVTSREAQGEERDRLWDAVVKTNPDYAEYQQRTSRKIPVVILEPRS